ncbi:MAG: DUF4381 family protein [Pseudomonadota bacterium]
MNGDDTLRGLADIIPPAPPAATPWWLWLLAALALIAIVALVWRITRRRTVPPGDLRGDALAALRALRSAWEAKQIDDRDAAYRLATVLRRGLGLAQLSDDNPPAMINDAPLWRDTLQQLDRQRYRRQREQPLPPELFERAYRWLTAETPHV